MLKIKFKKKVSLEESTRHNTLLSSKEFSKIRNILVGGLKDVASKSEVQNLSIDLYNNYLKDAPQQEKDMLKHYLEKHGYSMEFSEDGKAIGGLDRIFALIRKKADFGLIADEIVAYFKNLQLPADYSEDQIKEFYNKTFRALLEADIFVIFYNFEDGKSPVSGVFENNSIYSNDYRNSRNYYRNGNLEQEGTYEGGSEENGMTLTGIKRNYFKDGTLRNLLHYKSGQFHGYWYSFREDGTLDYIRNYENDIENGYTFEFYKDGKTPSRIANYKNNEVHGRVAYYKPNGERYETYSYYLNGERVYQEEFEEYCRNNPEDSICNEPETPKIPELPKEF